MSELESLVRLDSNIAALVGWGITPGIGEDGKLTLDGIERLDEESKDGLRRWLKHESAAGEPRIRRVIRALMTGRPAAKRV